MEMDSERGKEKGGRQKLTRHRYRCPLGTHLEGGPIMVPKERQWQRHR